MISIVTLGHVPAKDYYAMVDKISARQHGRSWVTFTKLSPEQEREHAEMIESMNTDTVKICNCGWQGKIKLYKGCPECGAKVRKV